MYLPIHQLYGIKDNFNVRHCRDKNFRSDLKDTVQGIHTNNIKNNLYFAEESISKELGDMQLTMQREEKRRQLLWERDPELRELRKKFLCANVTKDQVLQMAEKQAIAELKRLEEKSFTDEIRKQAEIAESEARRKEMEEMEARRKYHRDLEDLSRFKLSRESAYGIEKERERIIIDEMLKRINDEELEEKKRLIEKRKMFYQQTQDLLKVRDEMKQQLKHKDQVDQHRVDEYRKAQELRAQLESEKKQLSMDQKLQIQEKLLADLESLYKEKLKRELLRTELAVEEREAYELGKEQESEAKKMKIRQDLHNLYKIQMQVKKQREDLQKKEEELYRQNQMAKLYEEDRLELMSQQKRRQKRIEHLRLVKSMIEDKRQRKALEKANEMADYKYRQNLESEHANMVKEEKIRFLKEHATELLGYMPKGIFENNEMIELMGKEFKTFYSRKNCSK